MGGTGISPAILNIVLDGVVWLALRPDRFMPRGKRPQYPLKRRLGWLRTRCGRFGAEECLLCLSRIAQLPAGCLMKITKFLRDVRLCGLIGRSIQQIRTRYCTTQSGINLPFPCFSSQDITFLLGSRTVFTPAGCWPLLQAKWIDINDLRASQACW
jgi:hypothetical protein